MAESIPVVSSPKYLVLCFVFPVAILGTVFALHGVYPFGGKQILIQDFCQQFYPFLSDLWHKVREGSPGLPPWSWTAGGGHDYVALITYYMANPLNLFALMLPHAWLREVLTVILLVRIGCAGLFMGVFLRSAFKQGGLALPFFSSLYALCAFTLGYYYVIMWFDTFALLPLVALGLLGLVNNGKYRLYIVSLALSILTNFYMGIFICIFAALAFFGLCIIRKLNLRDFFGKLGLIAACSALAIGMAAVVIIPAYSALQNTYGALRSPFPVKPVLYNSFFHIIGNFIAFTPPTVIEGLPNLYCGMISVLLAGLFIYSAKVSLREKLVFAGTVAFLLLCCNLNTLAYIMHGFRFPVFLPSRFSFLISFILVVMAYRAFLLTEGMGRRGLLAMGVTSVVLLLAAVFGSQEKNYIIGSVVLCVVYLLIVYFISATRTFKIQQFLRTAFLLVILTELSITSYIAIKAADLTDRDAYPDRYEQIRALLDARPSGEPAGADFYRTDNDYYSTYNDPYLYNYNGISFFSSTVNDGVNMFMQGLGMRGQRVNSFTYNEASPLVNAFLNMRYMIWFEGNPVDNSVYWRTVGKVGDLELLENRFYLPLGFMVDEGITGYVHNDNPFLSQNDLFRRATGLDEDLFATGDLTALGQKGNEGRTVWGDFEVVSDGLFYLYCATERTILMEVFVNGLLNDIMPILGHDSYIFIMGSFSRGDTVSFSLNADPVKIYMGFLNSKAFERGYALLADETLHLTKFTDTEVSGNVTALKDGVLYTSIPGDKNWSVFVDGVKSEIVLIDNAMAAVRLSEGTHTVEFRYFNKSLVAGIIVSLVSLAVFAALVLRKKLPRRNTEFLREEETHTWGHGEHGGR